VTTRRQFLGASAWLAAAASFGVLARPARAAQITSTPLAPGIWLLDGAGGGQTHDCPVVARATTPPGLPAIGHGARRAGLDEVVARAEEHVAARLDDRAVLERR
jgi:hypothetical protein